MYHAVDAQVVCCVLVCEVGAGQPRSPSSAGAGGRGAAGNDPDGEQGPWLVTG